MKKNIVNLIISLWFLSGCISKNEKIVYVPKVIYKYKCYCPEINNSEYNISFKYEIYEGEIKRVCFNETEFKKLIWYIKYLKIQNRNYEDILKLVCNSSSKEK